MHRNLKKGRDIVARQLSLVAEPNQRHPWRISHISWVQHPNILVA